jgi:zeta-carotene desaturase
MAAAVALQSAGKNVTLIESRKTLGGRAGSFEDPQTGEILDNCQHVLLGCCTNLIDFYNRIGAEKKIHWHDSIHFVDEAGRWHRLWATRGLPAPLHLGLAFAGFSALSLSERLSLTAAMVEMLRLGRSGRAKLADTEFGKWLGQQDQPDALIDRFYNLVLVSALNENCRVASAEYAIQVFQEALLNHESAYKMGTPACALAELYSDFPVKNLRLGCRMTGVRFEGKKAIGVEIGSEFLPADAVVMAVNYPALEKWIPAELAAGDARFARLDELESVPILGAHLWFDRPVLDRPHAALMSGPMQWLFKKSADGRAVHGVISAARDWINRPRQECMDEFVAQIRRIFPAAGDAKLERANIIIEKRATFSPRAGIDRARPEQGPPANGIENLYLAGDYTRTGWPATMEGAVRSGYLAAGAICGNGQKFLVNDLVLQWPARILARQ